MGLLDDRQNQNDYLKKRFVKKVLSEAATDINKAQNSYFASRGFNMSNGWNDRTFNVTDNSLDYEHLKIHRFVDMKTLALKDGSKKIKKHHAIHNRIFWGHYNNIIRDLSFGFSEEIKKELRKMED